MTGCCCTLMRQGVNTPNSPSVLFEITGNYFGDLGFITGDHSEPFAANGAGGTISGNAILNQLDQTAAVLIAGDSTAPLTVSGNLMTGGTYCIYLGNPTTHAPPAGPAQNVTVTGNYISTAYYAQGGTFGPVASYGPVSGGSGNVWTDNYWYDGPSGGQLIPEPAGAY
jgi:hypothetical protein